MNSQITVRTRFEAAHRLPQLPGKCQQLHGHSWQAWITLSGPTGPDGTLVDFGAIKHATDDFTNTHFDHGLLLGEGDALAYTLRDADQKVHIFGQDTYTSGLEWPTVENVATCLARMATDTLTALATHDDVQATVERVVVAETENNQATAVVRP